MANREARRLYLIDKLDQSYTCLNRAIAFGTEAKLLDKQTSERLAEARNTIVSVSAGLSRIESE